MLPLTSFSWSSGVTGNTLTQVMPLTWKLFFPLGFITLAPRQETTTHGIGATISLFPTYWIFFPLCSVRILIKTLHVPIKLLELARALGLSNILMQTLGLLLASVWYHFTAYSTIEVLIIGSLTAATINAFEFTIFWCACWLPSCSHGRLAVFHV